MSTRTAAGGGKPQDCHFTASLQLINDKSCQILNTRVVIKHISSAPGTDCSPSATPADIDECALPTGGHICSYRCHNTPGSFHCSCPASGYTLAPNGRSCQGKRSATRRCDGRPSP